MLRSNCESSRGRRVRIIGMIAEPIPDRGEVKSIVRLARVFVRPFTDLELYERPCYARIYD